MRHSIWMLVAAALVVGCGQGQEQAAEERADAEAPAHADGAEPAAEAADDDESQYKHGVTADEMEKEDPAGTYGEGVTGEEVVAIDAILAEPASWEGKTVVVEGKITQVCPMAGCWIDLTAGDETIRVKVDDGVIVFPLTAEGHEARVQGVVQGIELTEEEAVNWKRHEAEETGTEFDPASVTGPMTIWRIKGSGASIS